MPRKRKFTGRVPPGPEWPGLRFQQYQFDPRVRRLGSGFMKNRNGSVQMDPEAARVVGLGRRSWTEEEAVKREIGEKHRVCELCGGRGRMIHEDVRCRGCQGSGVVKKEAGDAKV